MLYIKVTSGSKSVKALHYFLNKYQSSWKGKLHLANTEEGVENTCDVVLELLPLKHGNILSYY